METEKKTIKDSSFEGGKMDEKTKQRIEEIKKRLEEYKTHKNDPHAFHHEEIKAVRELKSHAPEDIEFLLNELELSKTRNATRTRLTNQELCHFQDDYNKFRDAGGAHKYFVEFVKLNPEDCEILRKNYESRKTKIIKT